MCLGWGRVGAWSRQQWQRGRNERRPCRCRRWGRCLPASFVMQWGGERQTLSKQKSLGGEGGGGQRWFRALTGASGSGRVPQPPLPQPPSVARWGETAFAPLRPSRGHYAVAHQQSVAARPSARAEVVRWVWQQERGGKSVAYGVRGSGSVAAAAPSIFVCRSARPPLPAEPHCCRRSHRRLRRHGRHPTCVWHRCSSR